MSEYIKTDDVVKVINVLLDNVDASEDAMHKFCDSMNDIQKVEIVRCEDCKHYKRNIPCVGGHYNGCDEWIDEGNPITVYDNDFCSYGERKGE